MKDYIKTSIWYREEITDPYQIIANYFDFATVADYRHQVLQMIKKAYTKGIWQKRCPANVLFSFEQLEGLINAAYLIDKENKNGQLKIQRSEAFNPNLFRGWIGRLSDWDYFPRSLSFKEYTNPYLVFKRFFKYRELGDWKKALKPLQEYVLSPDPVFECMESADSLQIYRYLLKLIEAAHLIDVREINHVGGRIKNRLPNKA
ncbi:hypothetical protein [Deminuibacter soli]|uniref:Uncharacterized protein n=1 Tax=Deminuibacter soli TaxID=2291815 RepID=A0A3E1NGB4_9BACT|nr:hypothetical protein [Deminuibacter soli]RFM26995.1 hypothetical protein DXN05_16060 [Deminuibacter soli]